MSKHDPNSAAAALAQARGETVEDAADAGAPPAAAPQPMVTLIGGGCDGQRVPRPAGTAMIATGEGQARELYVLSRAFLSAGQPVEFWHARFLPPADALARALDAYPRAAS